ncbi:MAG: hypothetical protein ACM3S2_13940 [Ignavibacteriales bacterium]
MNNNPLSDLISNDVFELLTIEGLLNKKKVREYQIQLKYRQLRTSDISVPDAMSLLLEEFPDLSFEVINKLLYQKY